MRAFGLLDAKIYAARGCFRDKIRFIGRVKKVDRSIEVDVVPNGTTRAYCNEQPELNTCVT